MQLMYGVCMYVCMYYDYVCMYAWLYMYDYVCIMYMCVCMYDDCMYDMYVCVCVCVCMCVWFKVTIQSMRTV